MIKNIVTKTNDRTFKAIKIIGIIAGLIFTAGVAWAVLNGRVDNVENAATEAKIEAKEAKIKADSNELAIVGLEKDVTYIREGIDRQEIILDKIQRKLYNGD